jgi:hypothetical protein
MRVRGTPLALNMNLEGATGIGGSGEKRQLPARQGEKHL